MGNLLFGTSDAQKAHNWVKSKKNRVLIVSYDALDVSQNLLKEILGGNNGISFLTSNTGPYPLATPENGNSYFDHIPVLLPVPHILLSIPTSLYAIMMLIMAKYSSTRKHPKALLLY